MEKILWYNLSFFTDLHELKNADRLYSGDVSRISVLGRETLFVNSWDTANDLLEKRSAIYSDRPEQAMLNEMWAQDNDL